jgi:hypothetical protein
MLGDMRRQGNAQGRAAEEERARAQAQLSAMHLASAGPGGGGPQQYGHGPPMGHQVRRLAPVGARPAAPVQCPRVHTRSGAAPLHASVGCLLARSGRIGCKRCAPPAASDAEALTACGAQQQQQQPSWPPQGYGGFTPAQNYPPPPQARPRIAVIRAVRMLESLAGIAFQAGCECTSASAECSGPDLGPGACGRRSTTSTSTGRRSTTAGRRRSTTAGRRSSTRRRRPGRRTARRRAGARRSSRRRRRSRPTRRRRSRRPRTPASTRLPACGAGGERGRARCPPRCGGPGRLEPQPAQLQGATRSVRHVCKRRRPAHAGLTACARGCWPAGWAAWGITCQPFS